ncbi:MAG: hypothetical protein AMXMBFR66_19480 [Pseudomonadota bacterium]|nr:hypothetical protein [Rubrivivax sp.]NLZ42891.1 hypothetical protein [Comamonadaceae bacterium]
MKRKHDPRPSRPHRYFGVRLAGATVGVAVMAGVAGLFGSASRQDWLAPTEANAAALRRCHALAGMTARAACVETVVATVKAVGATPRLAQADAPAPARRPHSP